MASSNAQLLGDVLGGVIKKMGIQKKLDAARTVEAWAVIAGPKINGITESAWLRGDTLYVKVTSAAWRHELHLQRRAWRDRLNEHLGAELVGEILFR